MDTQRIFGENQWRELIELLIQLVYLNDSELGASFVIKEFRGFRLCRTYRDGSCFALVRQHRILNRVSVAPLGLNSFGGCFFFSWSYTLAHLTREMKSETFESVGCCIMPYWFFPYLSIGLEEPQRYTLTFTTAFSNSKFWSAASWIFFSRSSTEALCSMLIPAYTQRR